MNKHTSAFFKALCDAVESGYLKPFSSVEGMMKHASLKAESFEEGNFIFLRRDYSFSREMTLQEALQFFIENTKEWQKEWKPNFYLYVASSDGVFGGQSRSYALVMSDSKPIEWYANGKEQGMVTKTMSYEEGIKFLKKVLYMPNKWHFHFTSPELVEKKLMEDYRKTKTAWLWYNLSTVEW